MISYHNRKNDDSNPNEIIPTLNSAYNEKKYAEILLHYWQLFIKDDIFIGERGIFGAEVFLRYRQFFVKSDFIIGRVECISFDVYQFLEDNFYLENFSADKYLIQM